MTMPLEYATPQPARRPNPLFFWLLYFVCGFFGSYGADEILHLWSGTISDGGCFVIGLFCLLPIAVAVVVARGLIGPRMKMWPWLGTLIGTVAPAFGLGTLIATGVI